MKPRQEKWRKTQWKTNGEKKKFFFFEKQIDEVTWMQTPSSAADYTCLWQSPRNSCPFVRKIILTALVLYQLGMLQGFIRISSHLHSPNQAQTCCMPECHQEDLSLNDSSLELALESESLPQRASCCMHLTTGSGWILTKPTKLHCNPSTGSSRHSCIVAVSGYSLAVLTPDVFCMSSVYLHFCCVAWCTLLSRGLFSDEKQHS